MRTISSEAKFQRFVGSCKGIHGRGVFPKIAGEQPRRRLGERQEAILVGKRQDIQWGSRGLLSEKLQPRPPTWSGLLFLPEPIKHWTIKLLAWPAQ
jgi:hypothetical protein